MSPAYPPPLRPARPCRAGAGAAASLPALAQDDEPSPAATLAADACVEPEPSEAPVTDEALSIPEDFRIGLFDGVWEGIRDLYVDPDTNGLDWEAIGDEYAPLVIATDNAHEVYELLGEMVALLDDPFTDYFAPEDLGDPATFDPSYGGIGALLDTSAAGEDSPGLRIVYVFEGGSAHDAGISARDSIVGVEGDPCVRIVDIRGPEGTDVTLTIVTPGEEPREVSLERRRINPVILPEVRRLEADPGVGYLQVLALSGQEAIDGIEQALTTLLRDEPLEGLILDLRASNQGAPAVVIEALAAFVEGEVGEYHSRLGNEPITIEPNDLADDYADMPLVVLVDEDTEADAEQLAAILQDQGRATIVGTQTSGQTHGTTTVDFADGSLLQIVSFGFQLPSGETLEGVGVTPDVAVEADWLSYPESEDPFLLAALEAIDAERVAAASAAPAADASHGARGVGRRIEVAGHLVAVGKGDQRRHHAFAGAGDGDRAARREGAAGGQVAGIGRLAAHDGPLPQAVGGVRLRHRGQQRSRVGVPGLLDELPRRRQLHDATGVHDRDAVGEVARAGEVVGDVEEGQLALLLQLGEQVQDLGAAGGVDHGDGLVSHEVVGLEHHGAGDADALALPARERVRVLLGELGGGGELDLLERRQHAGLALVAVGGPWMTSGSSTSSPTRM